MTATLINAFIIPEDKEEDFVENWKWMKTLRPP